MSFIFPSTQQHISFYASHPSPVWFIGFLWQHCADEICRQRECERQFRNSRGCLGALIFFYKKKLSLSSRFSESLKGYFRVPAAICAWTLEDLFTLYLRNITLFNLNIEFLKVFSPSTLVSLTLCRAKNVLSHFQRWKNVKKFETSWIINYQSVLVDVRMFGIQFRFRLTLFSLRVCGMMCMCESLWGLEGRISWGRRRHQNWISVTWSLSKKMLWDDFGRHIFVKFINFYIHHIEGHYFFNSH